MINTNSVEQARKLIKCESGPVVVQSQNTDFNRKILEYGKFDILLFPEETEQKKDKLRQLETGLNHVMARIAKKNNVSIGIDLEKIRDAERKEKALILSRLIEIIKTCRKAGAKIRAINYEDKKDAFELLLSLGASTEQTNQAVNYSERHKSFPDKSTTS